MTRLVTVTCFWLRVHVSRVYWAGIDRLRASGHDDVHVIAVVSPVDEQNAALARAQGDHVSVIVHANTPLGAKFNAGVACARSMRPDAVMVLGSDDLLSANAVTLLRDAALRTSVVGPRDFYFYDVATCRMKYWAGYAPGHERYRRPIGAGRILRRDALDRLSWAPWPVTKKLRSQDGLLDLAIKKAGIAMASVPLQPAGAFGVDIKSVENLWSFREQPGDIVDARPILDALSPAERSALAIRGAH